MAKRKLNVAMIGYDFMGRAHANAWRQVAHFFEDGVRNQRVLAAIERSSETGKWADVVGST